LPVGDQLSVGALALLAELAESKTTRDAPLPVPAE